MIRSPRLAVRRVRQTLSFENGPQVLLDMASARTRWSRDRLEFALHGGVRIGCPNVAGARLAVYEQFSEDLYRLDDLTTALPPDFVALDMGGQIGTFAIALATHSPLARIHVYEASPSTTRWLEDNIERNRLDDRVTVHGSALAGHHGSIDFVDNGAASVHNGLIAPEGSGTPVRVPCLTFAEAVAAAGGPVDVVKLDIEGSEYDAILSSSPDDWASVQRVVMEYHPLAGHSWSQLEEFFAEAGLAVVRREPITDRLGTVWLARTRWLGATSRPAGAVLESAADLSTG